jgi:hypothetical protein
MCVSGEDGGIEERPDFERELRESTRFIIRKKVEKFTYEAAGEVDARCATMLAEIDLIEEGPGMG